MDEDTETSRMPWWGWALLGAAGIVVIGGAVALLSGGEKAKPKPEQHVMHVALPPPPPPPKKPPEPEPVKQEVQKPQDVQKPSTVIENKPAAKPNPAPASAPLTAAAGAGSNAYGLAVGDGSGGSIGGGGGGGGGGSRFGAYAGAIQTRIEAALHDDEKTRTAQYLLKVSVWLGPNGQVLRVKIASSTGDPAMDKAIERVIAAVDVGQAPPGDMPQPVNLQVRARAG